MKNNKSLIKSLFVLGLLSSASLISCGDNTSSSQSSNTSKESSGVSSSSVDKANEVISLINSLSSSSTEEEIANARKAYDELDDEEKNKIDEAVLKKLVDLEKDLENKKNASRVIALIDALNEASTDEEVNLANEAYEELNEASKALVTNLEKLNAAKTLINDKKEAAKVVIMIDALSDSSTEEEISAVDEAYLSLSEQAKSFVTNLDKLNQAKQNILDIKSSNEVIGLINDIANNNDDALLYLSQKEKIELARYGYDLLPATAKAKVTNYSLLLNYETRISYYDRLLIDGANSILTRGDSNEYTYPTNVSYSKDEDYGDTFDLTLNIGTAYKKIEIFLDRGVDSNSLSSYEKVFFYFYSPQDTALNLTFGNSAWKYISLPSGNIIKGWNKVEANVSEIIAGKNEGVINAITSEWEEFDALETTGWKITPIYGMKKKPADVITNIVDGLPASIDSSSTFDKVKNISKLAYAEKLFNESLSENEKAVFDKTKIEQLSNTYSSVGKVAFGMDSTQLITSTDQNFVSSEFDSSSSFASMFGQAYKLTFKDKMPMSVHWMNISGSVDAAGYSKLAMVAFNDLGFWGNASGYADKLYFNNGDPWFSIQQGIPGSMENDGLGKGIGVLEGDMDFSSGTSTLSSAQIGFQNTWDVTNGNNLYLSPIVILK